MILSFLAKNCMKMKKFWPPGGGARPLRPPLDPPLPFQSETSLQRTSAQHSFGPIPDEDGN